MGKPEELLETLKKAILVERDGHEFYKFAAKSTADEQGKAVLESLAKDEIDHFKMLKSQYDSLAKGQKLKFTKAERRTGLDLSKASPIFSEDFKKRIKEYNFEMSALSVGVLLEKNSVEFYTTSADKIDDLDFKALFIYLADWEKQHLEALIKQQRFLQEDYWSKAQFYPF